MGTEARLFKRQFYGCLTINNTYQQKMLHHTQYFLCLKRHHHIIFTLNTPKIKDKTITTHYAKEVAPEIPEQPPACID